MNKISEWLRGRKTYATGFAGLVIGIVNLLGLSVPGIPTVDHGAAVQMIVTALLAIFLRKGITNVIGPDRPPNPPFVPKGD